MEFRRLYSTHDNVRYCNKKRLSVHSTCKSNELKRRYRRAENTYDKLNYCLIVFIPSKWQWSSQSGLLQVETMWPPLFVNGAVTTVSVLDKLTTCDWLSAKPNSQEKNFIVETFFHKCVIEGRETLCNFTWYLFNQPNVSPFLSSLCLKRARIL